MPDLIVVVPGILGSTLIRGGEQIWGYRAMLRHPRLLGDRLGLQPNDNARATGLLACPVHLPGLNRLDVYRPLLDSLQSNFEVTAGENLICFPYDWRRSCRESALELDRCVNDALAAWRDLSADDTAGVILICHSMGGLVARWYLDVVLRGKPLDHVRTLITLGTPYRGAAKAAGTLINGVLGWTETAGKRMSRALRQFPSIYELLPRYDCVEAPDNPSRFEPLRAARIEWPDGDLMAAADDFHAELSHCPLRYDLQVLISRLQRTERRLRVIRPDRVQLIAVEESGDGTVPRDGAQPYGWATLSAAKWMNQTHAGMHNGIDTWTQLHGVLAEYQSDMNVTTGLSLTAPEVVPSGEVLPLAVRPTTPSARPLLQVEIVDTESEIPIERRLLDLDHEHARYHASITGLAAGTYRIVISDPSALGGVTPISDLVTIT